MEEFLVNHKQELVFRKPVRISKYQNLMSFYQTIHFYEGFEGNVNNLPLGIEKIYFHDNFNSEIDFLPVSLKELKLGKKFNQSIHNLPTGLKKLELGRDFNKLMLVPPALEELSVHQITQAELNNLPVTLRKLKIEEITEKLVIPSQVEILNIYHHLINNIFNKVYDYFNFNFLLKPIAKGRICRMFNVLSDLSTKEKALEKLLPEVYFHMKDGDVITNESNYYFVLEEYGKKTLVEPNHLKFITFDKYNLYYWNNFYEQSILYIDTVKVLNNFEENEYLRFEKGYLIHIIYEGNDFWIFLEDEKTKDYFSRSIKLKISHLIFFNFEKKDEILYKYPEIEQICFMRNQFSC